MYILGRVKTHLYVYYTNARHPKVEQIIYNNKEGQNQMQIICYDLYEKEKKENEGKSIGELYYQKYNLSNLVERFHNLNYTSFIFSNTTENIVFYLHYNTYDFITKYVSGIIEYDFYIIENNGEYYIRYFNTKDLDEKASMCGEQAILNVSSCDEEIVGINTKKYQKYVINKVMSPKVPIDLVEIETNLQGINKKDFDLSYGLDYFHAINTVEILDFKNKITFCTDEYVLPKFAPYINFIEFIFQKCNIPCLKKCNLKYIDSFEEAKEKLIDKTIRKKYNIPYI